jgi:hypothetical protein
MIEVFFLSFVLFLTFFVFFFFFWGGVQQLPYCPG